MHMVWVLEIDRPDWNVVVRNAFPRLTLMRRFKCVSSEQHCLRLLCCAGPLLEQRWRRVLAAAALAVVLVAAQVPAAAATHRLQ
jgi:hypothetical protein